MSESLGVQEARRRPAEQLVINRHGQPVAALVPLHQRQVPQRRRRLELRGSGRGYWPDSAEVPPASGSPFDPHLLAHGALIGFEASALIAFLCGAADTGRLLTQLLEGIAEGFWRGQISCLCLMRLLEGPLSQGHGSRAQSCRQAFADGQAWHVVAADGAVVELLHGRALLHALDLPVVPSV